MTSKAPEPAARPVVNCPSCRRAVLERSQNPCFPFCSDRCKAIDLGRWFGGEYAIPVETPDDDEGGGAPPGDA